MSTEAYEKINAKDKPIAEDFVYVYSEIEDGGFRKVSKAMLKALLGVATKLSELENDKEFITKTVLDLENYYLKSDTYSKDEIDNRISLIPRFNVQVVSSLPTTDISETTVYLVSSGDDSDNLYTEYINVNGLWEILGTQKIASVENAVLYTAQSLTDEQKAQARTNISAASAEEVGQLRGQITNQLGATIPDYWKEFIDGKESVIKEKLDEGGADAFPILWGADIHGSNGASNSNGAGTSVTKNIGLVAKYTLDKYKAPYVLFSGDIMSQASHTSEENVYAEYERVNEILSPINEDKLLVEKGNHDGAWGSPVDGVYYLKNIGGKKIYNRLFRRQSLDRNRVFGGDGSYFYVDSPQNVRIIMLNGHTDGDGSVDADGNAVYNSMKNGVYGTEQLKWLCEVALNVSEGTRVIVSAHQPFSTSKDGTLLAGILEAYNKRTTYSGTKNVQSDYWGKDVTDTTYTNISVNADFTEAKGKVVIYLHGHIHKDTIDSTSYSFAVVSITTAGADVRDTDPPLRTPNTATETALDFVIMSKTAINFIRIGAGSDRVIALDDTVYYSIKNTLTNAKNSNSAGNIVAGNSYSATISANSGYELDSVVVTMGGVDVTSSVYADGVITISEVTGNVVITASATKIEEDEPTTGYTNLFDVNGSGFSNETSKFYTNWLPYNGDDNNGNGTIYHFKGLVYGAGQQNPYKMNFATDANGSNATLQFYCTAANKQVPVGADYDSNVTIVQHQTSGYSYVRFEIREALPDNLIITANEEITDGDSTPNYTNQIPISTDTDGSIFNTTGYQTSARINSSGAVASLTSGTQPAFATGFIPIANGDIVRFKNCYIDGDGTSAVYGQNAGGCNIAVYNSDKSRNTGAVWSDFVEGSTKGGFKNMVFDDNGNCIQFTCAVSGAAFMRFTLGGDAENAIVTVNEEIE